LPAICLARRWVGSLFSPARRGLEWSYTQQGSWPPGPKQLISERPMQMNLPSTHVRAKRKEGLTVSALDGEVLVYDPTTTRASCLNAFAAEVLVRCDGRRSPAEIARSLPFEDVDERVVEVALAD